MKHVSIGRLLVGQGQRCLLIAEAGVNHNGSLATAQALVDCAVRAGADAVKFQTFQAERLVTVGAPKAEYQLRATAQSESHLEMLRRLELSRENHRTLQACCARSRIMFLSTPLDEDSADFLFELGVPAFKIPSGELTNLPFLAHIARKGRPLIISTGMATLGEVGSAVETCREAGNANLILLHCVSNYPATPADVNLRSMQTMASAFDVPVGYSDHTLGIEISLAAVALGSCVIEKHVTLDRSLPGPDHAASIEPDELAELVRSIRTIEAALGDGAKKPAPSEAVTAAVARKSLVAARDIPAGSKLTEEMVAIKRPGTGLAPTMRSKFLGRTAVRNIAEGTLLTPDMMA